MIGSLSTTLSSNISETFFRQVFEKNFVSLSRLASHATFSQSGYFKKTLFSSFDLAVILVGWLPGQFTPIHDHSNSVGSVLVLDGTGFEERFLISNNSNAILKSSSSCDPGDIITVEKGYVHRLGNPSHDSNMVTIHVYSPPLLKMGTYKDEIYSNG